MLGVVAGFPPRLEARCGAGDDIDMVYRTCPGAAAKEKLVQLQYRSDQQSMQKIISTWTELYGRGSVQEAVKWQFGGVMLPGKRSADESEKALDLRPTAMENAESNGTKIVYFAAQICCLLQWLFSCRAMVALAATST